jgi:PAS domain S-box-containing protein
MSLSPVRKITIGLAVAAALVVVLAVIAFASAERFVANTTAISSIQETRTALLGVSSAFETAEGGARGYLITHDTAARQRYLSSVDSLAAMTVRLARRTADEPGQQARLRMVRALLDSSTARITPLVTDSTAPLVPVEEARQLTIGGADLVRHQLVTMDRIEQQQYADRIEAENRGRRTLVGLVALCAVCSVVFAWLMRRSLVRDLTGRARAQAALRASEAKFAGILDIAADAIITVDERQRIIHFNQGAETVFGYPTAEMIGQPINLLLPPEVIDGHRTHVEEFGASAVAARRMGGRREVLGRRRSGEHFPVEASISKLRTPDGMLFTAVMRDITERKRLEHHEHVLAAAGAQLAATLDYEATLRLAVALPVGTIGDWAVIDVVEQPGEVPHLRRIASTHADPQHNDVLQAYGTRRLHWDAPSEVLDVLRHGRSRLLADVTSDWLEAHAEDATELEILQRLDIGSLLIVPLIARGRAFGVLTIGSLRSRPRLDQYALELAQALADRAAMTIDNARLYRDAQQATRGRDEVLAAVSHDLRNPVSAIAMIAQRLVSNPPARAEDRRELYATIVDSAQMMYKLMRDLLDVASIEAGRLSVHTAPELVAPMIDAAIALVSGHPRAAEVPISSLASPDLPPVVADRERIVQVLANLLDNALKFTERDTAVTVDARVDGDQVVFTVGDQGPGIPPEELPHLFERFWEARRNSLTRGTGLGLAIAQGIVTAHGGRIWVETAAGRGSAFHFTLRTT